MSSAPVAAVVVFAVAASAAFAVIGRTAWQRPSVDQATPISRQAAAGPLELVALENDRDGDRFIVRGIIRNPATVEVDGLVAAVSLFGADGMLISSGHAAVASARLPGGAETPFVVIVTDAGDVDRYHLSFRTAAGIVPHLDKRASSVVTDFA